MMTTNISSRFEGKSFILMDLQSLRKMLKGRTAIFIENLHIMILFPALNVVNRYILKLMSKQSQKRIIQINHAISGIFGDQIKSTATKINEARKESLKKLERKKKLAPIIHDELYSYLQKFPEEKLGLNQQFVKKKKARLSQFEQKQPYKCPSFPHFEDKLLINKAKIDIQSLNRFFQYKLNYVAVSEDSEEYKS